jgi:hypothetical protein
VYSLTPRVKDEGSGGILGRPATFAVVVLALTLVLNLIFR